MVVDYFTKWAEAEPLATITEQKIRNFVWRSIICRFGIPRVLVSDNGKQFDNAKFRDFCAELGIKNYYSSRAHPQSNSQVEVTIRTLIRKLVGAQLYFWSYMLMKFHSLGMISLPCRMSNLG